MGGRALWEHGRVRKFTDLFIPHHGLETLPGSPLQVAATRGKRRQLLPKPGPTLTPQCSATPPQFPESRGGEGAARDSTRVVGIRPGRRDSAANHRRLEPTARKRTISGYRTNKRTPLCVPPDGRCFARQCWRPQQAPSSRTLTNRRSATAGRQSTSSRIASGSWSRRYRDPRRAGMSP